ncbi:MAG: type II toxin-antitoxin system HicA family toxin [Crocosphaera sp.]|jgi:predicted RNA binding protein YcfA (HicA-like mRNA interferase family)
MPPLRPIKRQKLIRYLKQLGFQGPYVGKRHQFMIKDNIKLIIPNPHQSDIGKNLLAEILRQADISREDWEQL